MAAHVDSTSNMRGFDPIAIIGMRGRFPGANDLDQFWHNLANGVESITTLSAEDMRASGIPEHVSRLPGYVNASPILDAIDEFDAEFFGFSARDASLTDPQQRIFIETAWEALEDAGYDPGRFAGKIGMYGGAELSSYLYQLYKNMDSLGYLDGMQLMVTNEKDYLCTQISYRLNLRGPSLTVQTACSTSLVAIALACESLNAGRSVMALAGGVTVRVPQRGGYFYTAGSILSPDGHCRPFDANAQGTIVGSGVGLVVLKRLSEAVADGDNIRAVILGFGVNNDGADKVGYTAPSFSGQAEAIREAQAMAGISAESIGYLEAHGTGTILGDPIEFAALNDVFRAQTKRRGFCAMGSVKSNFGHLSCAAGVAGLMKTVLAMEHNAIPPTLHYKSPNPAIDFASSPFYMTTSLQPWERNGKPRRAGISSFGVGGTNAHLILEEAPIKAPPSESRTHQLITLSARTETALNKASERLGAYLEAHPELNLADVAFTQHVGRRAFQYRRTLIANTDDGRESLIASLNQPDQLPAFASAAPRPIIFMFPGQGAQYPGMAQVLYQRESVVRESIDYCVEKLAGYLGVDLRQVLFPTAKRRKKATETLLDTRYAQPALFTVEYALAQLWQSWGIHPTAMIGHSVGEFVAATLAGVMTLDDALMLIARRGQLISALPRGSMLAVMAPANQLERFVDDEVSIAAINAPGYAVLSGPNHAIDRIETSLSQESVAARRLHTSHAFHSSMMEPILQEFEELVTNIQLTTPSIPFVATLNGEWANGSVIRPNYWSAQLRSTVRFADGLRELTNDVTRIKDPIFLEVGPGRTLTTFAMATVKGDQPTVCLNSLPSSDDRRSDIEIMLTGLGQFWSMGSTVDWNAFHHAERRMRVSLPTYPFERRSYWVGELAEPSTDKQAKLRDTSKWFHRPVWHTAPPAMPTGESLEGRRVLVFDEEMGLGASVINQLQQLGSEPVIVRLGTTFERLGDNEYVLDPAQVSGFRQLAVDVCQSENRLAGVIDCWSAKPPANTDYDSAGVITLLSPMRLAHSLSSQQTVRPLPMLLVVQGTTRVHNEDKLDPARALSIGPAKVLPQEHPGLRVAHIDVDSDANVAQLLLAELLAGAPEPSVALREGHRFAEAYEPVTIDTLNVDLPDSPVIMITGGLGHMGIHLAQGLFDHLNARLVLVGRSALPDIREWDALIKNEKTTPATKELLQHLVSMRSKRDDVLVVTADMNNPAQVTSAVDHAIAHFGHIDMVIHGAARVDAAAFASAAETGPEVVEAQMSPKLRGLFYLQDAFQGREPKRWVLHSSISSVLGGLGLAAYSGANAVLDTLALKGGANWLSLDWDAWDNAAEAQMVGMPRAIQPLEGQDAFMRALAAPAGSRLLVVVNDLTARLRDWIRHTDPTSKKGVTVERHPRPNLTTAFVEARTDTERKLAEIWAAQLGVVSVGIHDRFFDLGGHSLLAVQVASEIRDQFQIEMPVLKLFQAPTIAELATIVNDGQTSGGDHEPTGLPTLKRATVAPVVLQGDTPSIAAKSSYQEFYDDVTRKLERSGVGEASFFLNYGYISLGNGDEAKYEVPDGTFNPSSVRLVYELIGATKLKNKRMVDVGCGRGGTVALLSQQFGAKATGVDLSPEAIAFCRRTHVHKNARFEVGDAENLPFDEAAYDIVTNIESSHTYPNLRTFFGEVKRVLAVGGWFLYTDLLPIQRWTEIRALLGPLGLKIVDDRHITPNVLASCDNVAATRAQAFDETSALMDNFLAVPGSAVYEQMHSGSWEYRIIRAKRV